MRGPEVKTPLRRASDVEHRNRRVGAFKPAHRLSDPWRHVRDLLATRDSLVRTRTRWILLVRDLLRREGLRVRSGKAESFASRVHELERA